MRNKYILPEKIGIKYTTYPDWDWVIDQLVTLADNQNRIIDYLEAKEDKTG